MPTPGVTITGKLETIAGANDPGSVVVTLVNWPNENPPRVSGTTILSQIQQIVQAAAGGTFSLSLWGNYQLTPAGTIYQIAVYPAGSAASTFCAAYQFTAPGVYDLSVTAPLNPILPPTFPVSGSLASVFGRTGTVTAQTGDYNFSQLSGSPLNNVVIADNQAGADWGAKVNAADVALGATKGEIWISQVAGTSAPAADITLNAGHVLRFIQAGTYNLGTSRIVIPGGGSDSAIIGAPSGTLLNYTGNAEAILVGSASADTLRVFIHNIQIQMQSAGSSAIGIHGKRVWWPVIRDCMILSANGASVVDGKTAMMFDGTGSQCVYIYIDNPIIAGSFTNGIVFGNLAGLNNLIIGGSLVNETLTVQSGSTGVSYDATSDGSRILSTDFESWGVGIYCNGQDNWLNARTEACTTNVKFDTSSRANCFVGTALNVPTDLGTFNAWQLLPGVGQAIGTKLQGLTVAGPGAGAGTPAPLSFQGGVAVQEDQAGTTLSQRNGLTAQNYRVFTSTDGSGNFLYLQLLGNYAGSNPGINVVGGGTFANSDLNLASLGTGVIRCRTNLVIPTFTPASSAAAGVAGQVAWDASFIYICTATNTWKRVAIATW